MIRALVDTDVILDVLLAREPFVDSSSGIWRANESGRFEGYVSAITPLNVFYIAKKLKNSDTARRAVREILQVFRVCPLDRATLDSALSLEFKDYEDSVQHACADALNLDAIISRNTADYATATIPVYSPDKFLPDIGF